MRIIPIIVSVLVILAPACQAKVEDPEIITVQPRIDPFALVNQKDTVDTDATLASLQELGSIYLMTIYGDYSRQVAEFHKQVLSSATTRSLLRLQNHCSLFSYYGNPTSPLFGRNFDNVATDLLIGYYFPENGYASIAFTPMKEMGFKGKTKLNRESSVHKFKLLNAPCLSIEGMNEKGLSLAMASVEARNYTPEEGKPPKFIIHLVRDILDQAGSVDEAVELALQYNLFDNGLNQLSHHLMVAGPDGQSVLLEHDGEKLQVIPNDGDYQAATNHPLYNVSLQKSRRACDRFRKAWDTLADLEEPMSWRGGLGILEKVKQVDREYDLGDGQKIVANTIWSAVFDMKKKEIYLCMNMDFGKVYRFVVRDRAYYAVENN